MWIALLSSLTGCRESIADDNLTPAVEVYGYREKATCGPQHDSIEIDLGADDVWATQVRVCRDGCLTNHSRWTLSAPGVVEVECLSEETVEVTWLSAG